MICRKVFPKSRQRPATYNFLIMLRAHATLRRAGQHQRRLAHHAAAGTSFESEFITERLALNPSVAKLSGARVQPTVHVSFDVDF